MKSIEIIYEKDNKIVYCPDKNYKEIEEFMKAFNYGNSLGNFKNRTKEQIMATMKLRKR